MELSAIEMFFACLMAFLLSTAITCLMRLYAIRNAIFDIPNERSSHTIPTPRGGGMAIVITFNLSILWLAWEGLINNHLTYALLGGGIAIAVIGYLDDVYSLKARYRILAHIFAAGWALFWIGGISILNVGWLGSLLTLIAIVWCINFYNFMDGIDGLAGSEGIFVAIASGIALWIVGSHNLGFVMWLFAFAIAGFTLFNWQPAKIFLGDIGSGFLGFMFATFALFTIKNALLPISFWWIVLAVFICDSTLTLLKRALQGKKIYQAHREHTYQVLVSLGVEHKKISLGVIIINTFVLFPIALSTLHWRQFSLWLTLIVTILLCGIWSLRFKNKEV